jgi:hypothetical protein
MRYRMGMIVACLLVLPALAWPWTRVKPCGPEEPWDLARDELVWAWDGPADQTFTGWLVTLQGSTGSVVAYLPPAGSMTARLSAFVPGVGTYQLTVAPMIGATVLQSSPPCRMTVVASVPTGTAQLTWPGSASAVGYRIALGSYSGSYDQVIEAGTTTSGTLEALVVGWVYYVRVTAYDAAGRETVVGPERTITVTNQQTSNPFTILGVRPPEE